jgi:putative chitinase
MSYNLTLEQFQKLIPSNKEHVAWYNEVKDLLPKYEITTRLRIAAFITQCAHESGDFRILQENLNYSEQGLMRIFPRYFTNGLERSYARKPQNIANRVYANRMGNGPESSGDGWRYRGRGIIQLTGFNNYTDFARYIRMTVPEVIQYVETKRGALESACWFWKTRNINVPADNGDIERVTRLINGGTHGLNDRIKRYNTALSILPVNSILNNSQNTTTQSTTTQNTTTQSNRIVLQPVKRGDNNETVKRIQEYLKITADGIFGINTENSLKRWQQFNNLMPTGIADHNTLKKMFPDNYT